MGQMIQYFYPVEWLPAPESSLRSNVKGNRDE